LAGVGSAKALGPGRRKAAGALLNSANFRPLQISVEIPAAVAGVTRRVGMRLTPLAGFGLVSRLQPGARLFV
jgi:hypothetical protein